jgi:hypothetical protein
MSDQQFHDLASIFARKISKIPQPENPPEFTYQGKAIPKIQLGNAEELKTTVEQEVSATFHLEDLFSETSIAKSPEQWGVVIYNMMGTAYVLDKGAYKVTVEAVTAAVRAVKDDKRVEILQRMVNNLYTRIKEDDEPIYDVESLKAALEKRGAFLEAADDEVLQQIFEGTLGQEEDFAADWIEEDNNQITEARKGAEVDLEKLIAECSGNLYTSQVGTVVGGIAIKGNAKKVAGLKDASARIDTQNPPPGAFNIQYQTGTTSHACVIFDQTDPQEIVLEKLLQSFKSGRQLRSPRVKARH